MSHSNDLSARPCGCDPGCNWTCETHQREENHRKAIGMMGDSRSQGTFIIKQSPMPVMPLAVTKTPDIIGPTRASTFPPTAEGRKARPVASGVLDYFPDALVAIAQVSWTGNEQHNPGQPLHWARNKSSDEADALMRHFLQRGSLDDDGQLHSAKMAWRALALLQKEIEQMGINVYREQDK